MRLGDLLKTWRITAGQVIAEFFGGLILNGPLTVNGAISQTGADTGPAEVVLVFGAAIPVDLSLGNAFKVTLTSNAAFAFSNPTGVVAGATQAFTIRIINASGVAHGAGTFGANYKVSGNVAAIATANNRTIGFLEDGTNAFEQYRTAADVAN